MTGIDYAIVIGFLLLMALGGLWVSRLIKDSDDFFVAGRELTPFILAATITATNLSMVHFVGMGGQAYGTGISMIWQNWTGCMALIMSGIFVLPLMRRLKIRSIPEFLELRYTRGMRTLVGLFWGIRLSIYLGLLLYIACTAAIGLTGWDSYAGWMAIFSLVAILYSVVGGAWAVAIMDSVQFVVMLAAGLIIFPVAMYIAGGLPATWEHLKATSPQHTTLVPASGGFSWLFITSMLLLGFKFATVDQSILQRAFGAKSPRVGAKGMVLSALITIPLAFLWILPGLGVAKVHPEKFLGANGLPNNDLAIPWLMQTHIPPLGVGVLGFVLCGLLAAQISTITADVNSVATVLTSDVYRTLKRTEPTQRQLLNVVRWTSLLSGVLMLLVAWLFQYVGNAVKINNIVVSILDMPLFVVTVVYGLAWKRTNWHGALAGFLIGGLGAVACYALDSQGVDHARQIAPIVSTIVALIVTPIVTLLTAPPHPVAAENLASITRGEADEGDAEPFHLIPDSLTGKLAAVVVIIGFVIFVAGVLSAPFSTAIAGVMAVVGMLMVVAGGVTRVYVT
jgi:SSS family solute:Na+ symporter